MRRWGNQTLVFLARYFSTFCFREWVAFEFTVLLLWGSLNSLRSQVIYWLAPPSALPLSVLSKPRPLPWANYRALSGFLGLETWACHQAYWLRGGFSVGLFAAPLNGCQLREPSARYPVAITAVYNASFSLALYKTALLSRGQTSPRQLLVEQNQGLCPFCQRGLSGRVGACLTGWCPRGDRETWDGRVRRRDWSRGQGWKGRGGVCRGFWRRTSRWLQAEVGRTGESGAQEAGQLAAGGAGATKGWEGQKGSWGSGKASKGKGSLVGSMKWRLGVKMRCSQGWGKKHGWQEIWGVIGWWEGYPLMEVEGGSIG